MSQTTVIQCVRQLCVTILPSVA